MGLVIAAFFSALIFGLGLGVAGMTLPAKIIGFLDIGGNWDPSLIAVMISAIVVHAVSYRLIMKRNSPILATGFQVPGKRKIDAKLVVGSMIFGAGWGVGGFCPGPALVSIVSGSTPVLVFVISMIAGIYLYQAVNKTLLSKGG